MAKVIDFIDLEEIDNDDAKMCIIALFFSGEVKKWFRSLGAGTIGTSQQHWFIHGKMGREEKSTANSSWI